MGRAIDDLEAIWTRATKAVAITGLLLVSSTACRAATIVVDTLIDSADPPFNADGFCGTGSVSDLPGADGKVSLREAIIAANNTPLADTIVFANALSGGTIHVTFDDLDADDLPDVLPILCGGATTISGDIDEDGNGDITIDGGALGSTATGLLLASDNNDVSGLHIENVPFAAFGVLHVAAQSTLRMLSGNRLANNVMGGSAYGIFVIAGSTNPLSAGSISGTVISGNIINGTTQYDGIFVSTGGVQGSLIDQTLVTGNHVNDAQRHGIFVLTGYAAGGSAASISETTIRNNELSDNAIEGISAQSFAGQGQSINGLSITGNKVHNNGSVGIGLVAGVCGASDCVLEATVSSNTVTDNGLVDSTPGVVFAGGSNYSCPGTTAAQAATQNRLAVTAEHNTLGGNSAGHIDVVGGQVGANNNSVAATLNANTGTGGLVGIVVTGGMGTIGGETALADDNSVRAALSDNSMLGTFGGILLNGGNAGPASNNHVELLVERNTSCGSATSDLSCLGAFPGVAGFPANTGTGNVVSGIVSDNEATVVVADPGVQGNSCTAEVVNNRACGAPTPTPTVAPGGCAGDCDGSAEVTIDELLVMVNIALEAAPVTLCQAADVNRDDTITVDEILIAVSRALMGC
jgi:hypothetical protein